MSTNSHSTTTLGAHTNFYDSQTDEFDLDRDPKDPKQPHHDTPNNDDEDSDDDEIPSVDELLDRDRGAHSYATGTTHEEFVAGSMLRSYENPILCCWECFHDHKNYVELSDPKHHLPLVEIDHNFDHTTDDTSIEITKHDHRRHRHCPRCGYVSFGGTLPPRDLDELLAIVDIVLDSSEVFLSNRRNDILEKAEEWKRHDDGASDETILERVVTLVRYSLDVDFYDE